MTFYLIAVPTVLVIFALMFRFVKSGRLTNYVAGIDATLISAKPLLEEIQTIDLSSYLTHGQYTALILLVTLLIFVARRRARLKEQLSGPPDIYPDEP